MWGKSSIGKYFITSIIILAVGIPTAYAITITLGADPILVLGILDMMTNRIINLGTPTLDSDAATKAYVDSAPSTDTLALLGCTNTQIAQFVGSAWTCVADPTYSDAQAIAAVGPHTIDTDTLGNLSCNTNQHAIWTGTEWTCSKFVIELVEQNVVVDFADNVGTDSSIALAAGDIPVISYSDDTNRDLKVIRCGNTTCTSGNTIRTVDSAGQVGRDSSIALVAGNIPVISYTDIIDPATNTKAINVVRCGDTTCTSGNTIRTVDSGKEFQEGSLALAAGDIPVISYFAGGSGDLKVVRCGDTTCTSGNTIRTVDSADNVGRFTSIALATGDIPVISYYDSTNGDLKVVRCGDTTCTSGNTIRTVDSADNVGTDSSIALATGDIPVISYYDSKNGDLKVVRCGDTTCTSGNTIRTVDSADNVGLGTSIALATGDIPVISYYDSTNGDLKVVRCGDTTCTSGNTIRTVDFADNVGRFTSIALAAGDIPVISYNDNTNGDLKVFKDIIIIIVK